MSTTYSRILSGAAAPLQRFLHNHYPGWVFHVVQESWDSMAHFYPDDCPASWPRVVDSFVAGWQAAHANIDPADMGRIIASLSKPERIGLARMYLGGWDALRTAGHKTASATVRSLEKKGLLNKHGLTDKGRPIAVHLAEGGLV